MWEDPPDAAIAANEKYLQLFPDDETALVNLACACAQKGPTDKTFAPKTIETLRRVKTLYPNELELIRSLTALGESFETWRDNNEFKEIVGP